MTAAEYSAAREQIRRGTFQTTAPADPNPEPAPAALPNARDLTAAEWRAARRNLKD